MREMITFAGQGANFNFRVVGVVFDRSGERVLIHRAAWEAFWTLPGGRAELMEPAGSAISREMAEELGVEMKVERLLWVVENFFEYSGKQWHEIAFYFLLLFPDDCRLLDYREPFPGDEDGVELIFEWLNLDSLNGVYLLPSFLRTRLRSLPEGVEYIVHRDHVDGGTAEWGIGNAE